MQRRRDRIDDLAAYLALPRTALSGGSGAAAGLTVATATVLAFSSQPFLDPDPYRQFAYGDRLDALRGVSALLGRPLARVAEDDLAFVNALVERTRDTADIAAAVRSRFSSPPDIGKDSPC